MNEAIRKVLSEALPTLKDPRIGFVTVTNPIRGSFSAGSASERTFRIASFTFLRLSALARDDHLPVGA